jgi:hypothetical protein
MAFQDIEEMISGKETYIYLIYDSKGVEMKKIPNKMKNE